MRSMRTAAALALATALVVACQSEDRPAAGPAKSYAELEDELGALVERMGEDAYTQPDADEIVRQLEEIPEGHEDRAAAQRLVELIRAKRKIAWQVQVAPPPEPRPRPHFGPREGEGPAPEAKRDVEAAEKIGPGATREALEAAYGACLVRQTWFPAAPGGKTVELYQVKAECRERLRPRIFTVGNGVVERVDEGQLDAVMTTSEPPAAQDVPGRPPMPRRTGTGQGEGL